MKRRDLLKIGAGAAAIPVPMSGQQQAPAPAWKPAFFDAHQNQTVIALIDVLIPATDTPGAKAANVNRHIDHIFAAGPRDDGEQFLQGLAWLDGISIRTHGHPFGRCTRPQQIAILETLEAEQDTPGHQFFEAAKNLTSQLYYATEIGFRELNKGGRVPSSFACKA